MNFSSISKRRNELMGIAIVLILFCHWKECFEINRLNAPDIANALSKGTCGVDMFFMLSGVGLYFSYTKNNDTLKFYKKRFIRLFPAYFIITIPYWFIKDLIIEQMSFLQWIKDLFFISFFTEGMRRFWFIPAILIFYMLFPVVYYFIFGKQFTKPIYAGSRTIILVIIFVVFDLLCSRILPIYNNISIMLGRLPSFVIGIYLGYKSYTNKELRLVDYLIAPILLISLHIAPHVPYLSRVASLLSDYYGITFLALTIMEICLILSRLIHLKMIHSGLSWIGGITLETYVMHSALKNLFSYPANLGLYVAICVVTPIILGYFVHKLIQSLIPKWIGNQ